MCLLPLWIKLGNIFFNLGCQSILLRLKGCLLFGGLGLSGGQLLQFGFCVVSLSSHSCHGRLQCRELQRDLLNLRYQYISFFSDILQLFRALFVLRLNWSDLGSRSFKLWLEIIILRLNTLGLSLYVINTILQIIHLSNSLILLCLNSRNFCLRLIEGWCKLILFRLQRRHYVFSIHTSRHKLRYSFIRCITFHR